MTPAMREIVADLEHDGACQCQTCCSLRHHGARGHEQPEPASAGVYDDPRCEECDRPSFARVCSRCRGGS